MILIFLCREADANKAMTKDRQNMQHRYIELFYDGAGSGGRGGGGGGYGNGGRIFGQFPNCTKLLSFIKNQKYLKLF